MSERKRISNTTRFEVFKRDNFTCQYCGKSAPEVVLELDHVVPVSKGGTNDIVNLVTACFECNRGKGARELADDSIVKLRESQLETLSMRREQLEMMYQWQLDLVRSDSIQVQRVCDLIGEMSGYVPNDGGCEDIRKLLSEFGFETVLEATRIAFTKYDHETSDEWNFAFEKIGGICFYRTHKTCSQCNHDIGYDSYRHLVECEIEHDGGRWVRNDYAERCSRFESRYGG